eukprot:jgi/Mesvir1/18275/Mv09542-RA.1
MGAPDESIAWSEGASVADRKANILMELQRTSPAAALKKTGDRSAPMVEAGVTIQKSPFPALMMEVAKAPETVPLKPVTTVDKTSQLAAIVGDEKIELNKIDRKGLLSEVAQGVELKRAPEPVVESKPVIVVGSPEAVSSPLVQAKSSALKEMASKFEGVAHNPTAALKRVGDRSAPIIEPGAALRKNSHEEAMNEILKHDAGKLRTPENVRDASAPTVAAEIKVRKTQWPVLCEDIRVVGGALAVAAKFEALAKQNEIRPAYKVTWKTKANSASEGAYKKKTVFAAGPPPPKRSLADLP